VISSDFNPEPISTEIGVCRVWCAGLLLTGSLKYLFDARLELFGSRSHKLQIHFRGSI